MDPQKKAMPADVRISPDDSRTLVITASTAAIDREGEVLVPAGCYSKNWEKNPVITYNHSYWDLPVGSGVAIKRADDGVSIKLKLVERPPTYPANLDWLPDTLLWMYQQGAMRAASVGFISKEGRVANPNDMRKYGDDVRYVHSKWELLELALVPIPCNQEAIADAVSKGIFSQETADQLKTIAAPEEKTAAEDMDETGDGDEMMKCAKCGKEYSRDEMEPDDDGGMVCKACRDAMKSAIAPLHVVVTSDLPETPQPVSTRHIHTTINLPADPDEARPAKRVHRAIEPTPPLKPIIRKLVVAEVSKARGQLYVNP